MDRDERKRRAAGLRDYLQAHLPMAGVATISGLAAKAGLRHSTLTAWWGRGTVPDRTSLQRLAGAVGVDASALTSAYEGSEPPGGRVWVLTDSELQAVVEAAVEDAVRQALAERARD
jgi:transcriptional regulator with XRE-family HTH domain